MNDIDYTGDPRAVLIHFNPNHDPKTGQFAKNSSGTTKYSQREVGRFAGKKAAEYDQSDEGNKLMNKFFDSYAQAQTDEEIERARSYGADYVRKSAAHVMKSIIDKYGVEYASEYAGIYDYKDKNDLIDQYVEYDLYRNGLDDAHLAHFNPNHDPKTGQFAKKIGGRIGANKYRNPDGSLNERGEKRYAAELRKNKLKKKDQRVKPEDEETVLKDPNRWDREDTEEWKKISETGEKLVRSASDIERLTRPKAKKFDLSNMTDAELRSQINRWQMEDTYSRLKSERTEEVSKGRKAVQNILDYAGPALALTSSALAIAVSIKKLKE